MSARGGNGTAGIGLAPGADTMLPAVRIGSEAHKQLLCRFFMESHVAFDAAAVGWPQLGAAELAQLRSLPFWSQAVLTEHQTACTIQTWAELETDPLLQAAIALQGYEERRHAALLEGLRAHYGIALPRRLEARPPAD